MVEREERVRGAGVAMEEVGGAGDQGAGAGRDRGGQRGRAGAPPPTPQYERHGPIPAAGLEDRVPAAGRKELPAEYSRKRS